MKKICLLIPVLAALLFMVLSIPAPAVTIHPEVVPYDKGGKKTNDAKSVSDKESCGKCHDVAFINASSSHNKSGVRTNCIVCHLEESKLPGDLATIKDKILVPTSNNCAYCHGIIHDCDEKLIIPDDYQTNLQYEQGKKYYDLTQKTGTIFSPQSLSVSVVNIHEKNKKSFAWDVHARRQLQCIHCHYTRNDPRNWDAMKGTIPSLKNDPRKIKSRAEYLTWPNHSLVTAGCTSCHAPEKIHDYLPYKERHFNTLDCQSCHVPEIYGPALKVIDATVFSAGGPRIEYRGVDESKGYGESLNTKYYVGYKPYLVPYRSDRNTIKIAPFNFVTRWFWKSDSTGKQVPDELIKKVFIEHGTTFNKDIIQMFDTDNNKQIDDFELKLDTRQKINFIKSKLAELGIERPVIAGRVEENKVQHGVTDVKLLTQDCTFCHGSQSRFGLPIELAAFSPGQTRPEFSQNIKLMLKKDLVVKSNGSLILRRERRVAGHYVFGHSRVSVVSFTGILLCLITFLAVAGHGSYRYYTWRRRKKKKVKTTSVYMYPAYERIWHWTMAIAVIILLVSGLLIHYSGPDTFPGMRTSVAVHNVIAVIVVLNAGLSFFYHLATGKIKHFFRFNKSFIQEMIMQSLYYAKGIFRGDPHPVQKTPERKLNPLQQLTYVVLLNVLIPFQVVTGILTWAVSYFPEVSQLVGGLQYITPLHSLGAWLFLAFLIVHLYLITTGHTVSSNLKAMITGFDEIEDMSDIVKPEKSRRRRYND